MDALPIRLTASYPLELHYIKALLLQKQYRQCIAACREALKFNDDDAISSQHPLQHIFVQFYRALAHDELARAMHSFSQAKVPAFNQAEQLYYETLAALPNPRDCMKATKLPVEDRHDSCNASETNSRHTSLNSIGIDGAQRAQDNSRSPPFSPPTHVRNASLPTSSPPMTSLGLATSDFDDLESHGSFDEIMTPNRLPKLQRDYSSMSLLQAPNQQPTHGLMRPIRLGSIAKPYQAPTQRNPITNSEQQRSMLPKLNTDTSNGSPVRKQLRTASEQVSPVEDLVSPLGSEGDTVASNASTISPITPEIPNGGLQPHELKSGDARLLQLGALDYHLNGTRNQLESHIKLLQEARQQTLRMQAERSAARTAPNISGRLTALMDAAEFKNKRMPASRSYWSFTPEDVKVLEKQRRIQAGRERGWTRKRFDQVRYTELADTALAEL